MADPEMLGLLWQTAAGSTLICQGARALLLLAGLLFRQSRPWIALASGLLLLWSFTQIGHISAAGQPGLRILLFAHLTGIAFWIGVLGLLRDLARRPEHLEHAALLGHPGRLLTTGYGQTLSLKLVLISAVLILAALNKLRLVPALQEDEAHAGSRLARSIEIEALILLAVLAATAALTSVLTLPH